MEVGLTAENRPLDILIILTMILAAGWISSQFGQLEGGSDEAFIATNYQTMAIIALIIAGLSAAGFTFMDFLGLNKPSNVLIALLVIGGAVGFVLTESGKLALWKLVTAGAIDPSLSFFFVVVLAVFVEEYFFRGALFPTFKKLLKGNLGSNFIGLFIAAAIASALFAGWHWMASNGDESIIIGEFIFSMLQIGFMEATGSIAPALGVHFVRNIVTFAG